MADAAADPATRRGSATGPAHRRRDRGDGADPARRPGGHGRRHRRDPRAHGRDPAVRRGARRHVRRPGVDHGRGRAGVRRPGHDRGDGAGAAPGPINRRRGHWRRAGAVVGRRFLPSVVGQILSVSDEALAAPLAELVAHAFLEPDDRTGEYDFRNQLVRDAVYAAIPLGERRRLHGLVAELGGHAGIGSEVHSSEHFELAGRPAEAHRAALAGARSAAGISAHREAMELYRRAVRTLPAETPPEERGAILEALARQESARDETAAAAATLTAAREAYEEAGDRLARRPGRGHPRAGPAPARRRLCDGGPAARAGDRRSRRDGGRGRRAGPRQPRGRAGRGRVPGARSAGDASSREPRDRERGADRGRRDGARRADVGGVRAAVRRTERRGHGRRDDRDPPCPRPPPRRRGGACLPDRGRGRVRGVRVRTGGADAARRDHVRRAARAVEPPLLHDGPSRARPVGHGTLDRGRRRGWRGPARGPRRRHDADHRAVCAGLRCAGARTVRGGPRPAAGVAGAGRTIGRHPPRVAAAVGPRRDGLGRGAVRRCGRADRAGEGRSPRRSTTPRSSRRSS